MRIASLADGCLCCTAQVGLRVALTRLLREASPERLLIFATHQARIGELKRLLADRWFAPVLDMRATVLVLHANSALHNNPPEVTATGEEAMAEQLSRAQVIAVHSDDSTPAGRARILRRALACRRSDAMLVDAPQGRIDIRVLDLPGVPGTPVFRIDP